MSKIGWIHIRRGFGTNFPTNVDTSDNFHLISCTLSNSSLALLSPEILWLLDVKFWVQMLGISKLTWTDATGAIRLHQTMT